MMSLNLLESIQKIKVNYCYPLVCKKTIHKYNKNMGEKTQ